MANTICVR